MTKASNDKNEEAEAIMEALEKLEPVWRYSGARGLADEIKRAIQAYRSPGKFKEYIAENIFCDDYSDLSTGKWSEIKEIFAARFNIHVTETISEIFDSLKDEGAPSPPEIPPDLEVLAKLIMQRDWCERTDAIFRCKYHDGVVESKQEPELQPSKFSDDQNTISPEIPTRKVPLIYAAKNWFKVDYRTLKKAIISGSIKARRLSERLWEFDLDEVTDRDSSLRKDADPTEYNK